MRLRELFEADAPKKQLGRAFNHLEDLVFFYGSEGTLEALDHLKDFNTQQGAESIRMKWDGCIHEDTVLKTTCGDLTIKQVIEQYNTDPTSIQVFGKDLESGQDFIVNILGSSVTTGVKDWVEITLENGSTLKLTEDHEVYTSNRGWVAAGQLTTNDDIVELK